jgi:hypothetical protein
MNKTEYATVDDFIKILQKWSERGYGNYEIGCNGEYRLSKKEYDESEVDLWVGPKGKGYIDFGGYC